MNSEIWNVICSKCKKEHTYNMNFTPTISNKGAPIYNRNITLRKYLHDLTCEDCGHTHWMAKRAD